MSAGLSIHVIDIAGGVAAAGLRVDMARIAADGTRHRILDGVQLDWEGKCSLPDAGTGDFEALFHVAEYFDARRTPHDGFMTVIRFAFSIADDSTHHHLPLKFTPYGYSLFLTH